MIVKPTTAELLEKTGENKFCLVIATAKRARQISNGAERLVNSDERSTVTVAAEELAEGRVKIC